MLTSFTSKLVLRSISFSRFSSSCPQEHAFESSQKVQGRQVHYRARPHDQGQRLGLSERPWREQWVDGECVGEWRLWFAITPLNPLLPSISCWHTRPSPDPNRESGPPGGLCVSRGECAHVCVCPARHMGAHWDTWMHTQGVQTYVCKKQQHTACHAYLSLMVYTTSGSIHTRIWHKAGLRGRVVLGRISVTSSPSWWGFLHFVSVRNYHADLSEFSWGLHPLRQWGGLAWRNLWMELWGTNKQGLKE